MTWLEAMRAAFVATLGRGRWWIAALAAFLVRGGILALVPAIVLVPTPAELEANLTPSLTSAVIRGSAVSLVAVLAGAIALAALVIVGASLVGAWLDAGLVAEVAADEAVVPHDASGSGGGMYIPLVPALAARLVVHVPTLVAVVIGGVALGEATYAEVLSPTGSGSIVERVVARAPLAAAAIVGSWLVGEAWGGLAERYLGLGRPWWTAVALGLRDLFRPSGLATLALGWATVGLAGAGLWLAATAAFERAWPLVVDRADPPAIIVGLGLLAASWGAGLWLLAIAIAFRQAAWTAEVIRGATHAGASPRP